MFCKHWIKKALLFIYKRHICMGCNSIFSANRWQYEIVMKGELLMNPPQHFHDNRHNNFNVFTSHLLSTISTNKYKACVLDFISISIAYITTAITMISVNPRPRAAIKLAPY